jgi:hypothetical protein
MSKDKDLIKPRNARGRPRSRPIGRPTKFTPELEERFLANLFRGLWVETACTLTGVHKTTFYDWCAIARAARERLRQNPSERLSDKERKLILFMDKIDDVYEEIQATNNAVIQAAAARGVWQAACWINERRFPSRWALRHREDDRNVNVQVGFAYVQIVAAPEPPYPEDPRLIEGEVLNEST